MVLGSLYLSYCHGSRCTKALTGKTHSVGQPRIGVARVVVVDVAGRVDVVRIVRVADVSGPQAHIDGTARLAYNHLDCSSCL